MANSSRVLFVGGCHLNGHLVGKDYALTQVAMRSLPQSMGCSLDVLPLCNLRSGPKILAACRELRPDAVVLQLGHYETQVILKKILGLKRLAGKEGAQGQMVNGSSRADLRYRLTPSTRFVELRRIVAAGVVIAMGKKRRMFDPAAIAASLDSMLLCLKDLPLRGIVLVGPFSAPDPVTRFFRRREAPIFEAAAKKHGCAFVDIFSVLEAFPNGEAFRANFADREHLSVLGHHRVGVLVGAALKRVMEQSTATGAEFLNASLIKELGRAARPAWVGQTAVAGRS